MKRRLCQYCEDPLSWWAYLLLRWTCNDCVYRRARSGQPMTPEGRRRIRELEREGGADREPGWLGREVDKLWAAKQSLAAPARYYGEGGTLHGTTELDVETDEHGRVVAVWYRCQMLPFKQRTVDHDRAADMAHAGPPPIQITGVEVLDLPSPTREHSCPLPVIADQPRGASWSCPGCGQPWTLIGAEPDERAWLDAGDRL